MFLNSKVKNLWNFQNSKNSREILTFWILEKLIHSGFLTFKILTYWIRKYQRFSEIPTNSWNFLNQQVRILKIRRTRKFSSSKPQNFQNFSTRKIICWRYMKSHYINFWLNISPKTQNFLNFPSPQVRKSENF